ncbi:hypothetical protein EPD60_12330 [Flaviaesturariibacter flavus]|uniref:Uncharacterized protein n=1 Tax=Flaviaesturariibacter flavus TaxID=2502780 RepID=A0A4R1B9K2_9BACT|nr:hypothetical protein [Flaviaesturariibacter flavus]TCJ13578.1 hypothetical protein EPD60_12330 [Flaviaesturariibacter flavus]
MRINTVTRHGRIAGLQQRQQLHAPVKAKSRPKALQQVGGMQPLYVGNAEEAGTGDADEAGEEGGAGHGVKKKIKQ